MPDLARELARRLAVPVSIVSAPNAGGVIGALNSGTADIGFLAYDEMRARDVDFGPPFVVMANSYLVKATSPIKASGDVDRAGVTVAAVKGQTQEHFVSSTMKRAKVRVFDVMPAQADVDMLLTSGAVDAFAINRQRALEAEAASAGRLRALPDSFLDVDQCVVVAKGNAASLEPSSGSWPRSRVRVHQAVDRARQAGRRRRRARQEEVVGIARTSQKSASAHDGIPVGLRYARPGDGAVSHPRSARAFRVRRQRRR